MNRVVNLSVLLICIILTACYSSNERISIEKTDTEEAQISAQNHTSAPMDEDTTLVNQNTETNKAPVYTKTDRNTGSDETAREENADNKIIIQAYKDFLFHYENNSDEAFPIYGYYLFDMNFDQQPELGVLHLSGGSRSGFFTFYYFDGEKIVPMLDSQGAQVYSSHNTQILADAINKKTYLLKEMYLIQGNENGTYGYLQQVVNQNKLPYIYSILDLRVDQNMDLSKYSGIFHPSEDSYLSDDQLSDCFILQYYSNGEWINITAKEYLEKKRECVPIDNQFVDLCNAGVNMMLYNSVNELFAKDGALTNKKITEAEINKLLDKWYTYANEEPQMEVKQ